MSCGDGDGGDGLGGGFVVIPWIAHLTVALVFGRGEYQIIKMFLFSWLARDQ